MPDEGRSLIYPTSAMMFGARPLAIPKSGNGLCVSAGIPFRLSTGEHTKPSDWYGAVMNHCGMLVSPDSMSPLPCSEVVILGNISPVLEKKRQAYFRLGPLHKTLMLYADPAAPGAPLSPDYTTAVWHEELNPNGRGGGDNKDQPPLITQVEKKEIPIWFGPTPLDHLSRIKMAGTPDAQSGIGWPENADPSVLCESHSAFWAEALHPGDPLEYEGLSESSVQTTLPKYRATMMYGHREGEWKMVENARIHTVMVIPAADIGVTIWRASIPLDEGDLLGENILAVLGAMEDISSPVKDLTHWAGIVGERWFEPEKSIDDRPLLPESLAENMPSPFAQDEEETAVQDRFDRAEEWVKEETGVSENPFGKDAPEGQAEMTAEMQKITAEEQPDVNKAAALAASALSASKKSHAAAGFPEKTGEEPREPIERGDALKAEMKKRLTTPYSSEKEVSIISFLDKQPHPEADGKKTVGKIADARLMSPKSVFNWDAFNDDEAILFGDAFIEHVNEQDTEYHVDASGMILDREERRKVADRVFDGLLAEETIIRWIDWSNCEFKHSTFSDAKFENCTFLDCVFEEINFSNAYIDNCQFNSCQFRSGQSMEIALRNNIFQNCTFDDLIFVEPVMQANHFTGGHWKNIQLMEGVLLDQKFEDMSITDTTFNNVHAPNNSFKRVEFFKFWGMAKGFPGCLFEEVKANKCGFVGVFHFDDSRFMRTHFTEVGFSLSFFRNVEMTAGCQFNQCDFTGSMFENTQISGVRFLGCSMVSSSWTGVQAANAWFYSSMLRGVDFKDTELIKAVFVDADLEGVVFQPEKTIGSDFRGTVMAKKE